MRARSWLKLLPGLLLAAVLAGTALAGGIVITLDSDVEGAAPNTPFDVDFTIRSMHDGSMQDGFTPFITAVNAETGATLKFDAAAGADPGRYHATVTLPAGVWNWSISPDSYYPTEFTAVMTPLDLRAAVVAAPVAAPTAAEGVWWWLAVPAVALAGLSTLGLALRVRRPRRVSVTA